jgi:hypothetical protein
MYARREKALPYLQQLRHVLQGSMGRGGGRQKETPSVTLDGSKEQHVADECLLHQ